MPHRITLRRLGVVGVALASCATPASAGTGAGRPLPDLTPAAIVSSFSALYPGATLGLHVAVANVGRTRAPASSVHFHFSLDRSHSRSDVRLEGRRKVPSIGAGRSSRGRSRLRIPTGIRPGAYWVLACVDAGRRVTESRERNNCRPTRRRLRVVALPPAFAPLAEPTMPAPAQPQQAPAPSPTATSPPSSESPPPPASDPPPPAPNAPPPPPPAAASPVLAAAGDVACDTSDPGYDAGAGLTNRCRHMQVSDLLSGSDKVLALGDLQYEDGTLAKFNEVYHPSWGRFKALTAPAIGNHEYADPTGGAAGYFDYFNGVGNFGGPAGPRSKGYYSFDLGAWHLVALNSNCVTVSCAAGSDQEQWLRADLAAHPSSCTLAFWHHPLFSSESSSAVGAVAPLWKALREGSVDVLLTGHAHNYERFARLTEAGVADPAGVRQFVVGTGGKNLRSFTSTPASSEFRDSDHFGVLKLSLHPDSYDWGFVTESGSTTDSGSEPCI